MFSEIFYILLFWSRRSRIKPSIGQKANGNNSKYHISFKKFHPLKVIVQHWQCMQSRQSCQQQQYTPSGIPNPVQISQIEKLGAVKTVLSICEDTIKHQINQNTIRWHFLSWETMVQLPTKPVLVWHSRYLLLHYKTGPIVLRGRDQST